jgi:hypothetical protein
MKASSLLAIAMLVPSMAFAQGTAKTKGPKKPPAANSGEMKTSGMTSGKPTATSFMLANGKGKYTVNVGKTPIMDKAGKTVKLDELIGGCNVSVWGPVKGNTIDANKIQVNYLRKPKAKGGETTPTTKTRKPKSKGGAPAADPKPKTGGN